MTSKEGGNHDENQWVVFWRNQARLSQMCWDRRRNKEWGKKRGEVIFYTEKLLNRGGGGGRAKKNHAG